jgi:hypothetical protein
VRFGFKAQPRLLRFERVQGCSSPFRATAAAASACLPVTGLAGRTNCVRSWRISKKFENRKTGRFCGFNQSTISANKSSSGRTLLAPDQGRSKLEAVSRPQRILIQRLQGQLDLSSFFLSEIYVMQGRPQDALPEIERVHYDSERAFLYAIAYHALGRCPILFLRAICQRCIRHPIQTLETGRPITVKAMRSSV